MNGIFRKVSIVTKNLPDSERVTCVVIENIFRVIFLV